ncbi:MAG: ACT domain-containing protein [Lachnospiraceae bacterium]|jgi:ACT domain-containing protein|nr:ACT domain-containing protein [Lachnospiraceae bacterium]MCX4316897.1 ACT domain-containing protein [Lachnospiraceae bacterium]
MKRAVITVVGKDSVGIIAKVCTFLAENQINILDISQTIVQGFFHMMMVVDLSGITVDFSEIADGLTRLGEEQLGVKAQIQREEIFDKMHRI